MKIVYGLRRFFDYRLYHVGQTGLIDVLFEFFKSVHPLAAALML